MAAQEAGKICQTSSEHKTVETNKPTSGFCRCYPLSLDDFDCSAWLSDGFSAGLENKLDVKTPFASYHLKKSIDVRVTPRMQTGVLDRKSTRLNSSHVRTSRMPSSA